jgi:hypothetical protein
MAALCKTDRSDSVAPLQRRRPSTHFAISIVNTMSMLLRPLVGQPVIVMKRCLCVKFMRSKAQPSGKTKGFSMLPTLGFWLFTSYVVSAPSAFAICSTRPPFVAQPSVASFLLAPKNLLKHARNLDMLSDSVSQLLIADTRLTLPKLIGLVRYATSEQKTAIGNGMAKVVNSCIETEPQSILAIREAVRKIDDIDLSRGFVTAQDDLDPTITIDGFSLKCDASLASSGKQGMCPAKNDENKALKTVIMPSLSSGKLFDPFRPITINKPWERFN